MQLHGGAREGTLETKLVKGRLPLRIEAKRPSRRQFLRTGIGVAGAFTLGGCATTKESVPILSEIFENYDDEVTGARIYNLTPGPYRDSIVYQTHPQWTPGMEHALFTSDRSTGDTMLVHAVQMTTGAIRPILNAPCSAFALSSRNGHLFYLVERELYGVNVKAAFEGLDTPRRLGQLPEDASGLSGGMSVDATETKVYVGVEFEPGEAWGIAAIRLSSGQLQAVAEVDFPVGHVQANPYLAGEILFCHETGGDSDQRMWFVRTDGQPPRPMYKETYNEWVTHEVWWRPDSALFTIWPYDDAHKEKPHGIAVVRRDSGDMRILCQYPAWHTQGSPNGNWLLGDDFDRNLWIIDAVSGERRLLTQGHNTSGFDTHPHASFLPDSRSIVLNSSRNGTEDLLLVEIPEFASLPPA